MECWSAGVLECWTLPCKGQTNQLSPRNPPLLRSVTSRSAGPFSSTPPPKALQAGLGAVHLEVEVPHHRLRGPPKPTRPSPTMARASLSLGRAGRLAYPSSRAPPRNPKGLSRAWGARLQALVTRRQGLAPRGLRHRRARLGSRVAGTGARGTRARHTGRHSSWR